MKHTEKLWEIAIICINDQCKTKYNKILIFLIIPIRFDLDPMTKINFNITRIQNGFFATNKCSNFEGRGSGPRLLGSYAPVQRTRTPQHLSGRGDVFLSSVAASFANDQTHDRSSFVDVFITLSII